MSRRLGQRQTRRGRRFQRLAVPSLQDSALLWLRADSGIVNTTAVDSWTSRAGLLTQFSNTGTARPTFVASNANLNNQPTVRFTAAQSQYLVDSTPALANALDGAQPFTSFVVAKRNAANTGILWSIGYSGNLPDAMFWRVGEGTAKTDALLRYIGGAGSATVGTQTDDALPCLYLAAYSGAAMSGAINNVASAAPVAMPALNPLDMAAIGVRRYAGAFGTHFDGDIAEILVFDRVLLAAEIIQLTAYFKDRYALFMPGFYPALHQWHRADYGVTIATGVSNWGSKVGTGAYAQGAGAQQPPLAATSDGFLNSQPALKSTAHQIDSTALVANWNFLHDGTTDWTLLWVLRPLTSGAAQDCALSGFNPALNGVWLTRNAANNINCSIFNSSGAAHGDVTTTGGAFVLGAQVWFAARYTRSAPLDILWSGGGKASAPLVGPPNAGNASFPLSWRGRNHYQPEHIIWKSALSDADIQALASKYLAVRYGVAA